MEQIGKPAIEEQGSESCPHCGRPLTHKSRDGKTKVNNRNLDRIFNQSSIIVGVCLTLLGIIKVIEGVKNVDSLIDELLAIDAVGFLLAGVLSYFALKAEKPRRKQTCGKLGDLVFTASLCLLAVTLIILAIGLA